MSRAPQEIPIIVHYPTTEAGWAELSGRVAKVHADYVTQKVNSLNCPQEQKAELMDAVISETRKRAKNKEYER